MLLYNNDDKTFREFSDYCSKTVNNLDIMDKWRARLTGGCWTTLTNLVAIRSTT